MSKPRKCSGSARCVGRADRTDHSQGNQTTVTGKVLDCLASHLGMASSASHPLQLLKVSRSPPQQGEKCVLLNDRAIVDNIEDGELLVVAALE